MQFCSLVATGGERFPPLRLTLDKALQSDCNGDRSLSTASVPGCSPHNSNSAAEKVPEAFTQGNLLQLAIRSEEDLRRTPHRQASTTSQFSVRRIQDLLRCD
ncbi:hypothetical protein FHX59_007415 [Paraburkholderia silvatlantica]|uniref:Uncharacterized protein n=1 Tax=Paraburkholderia silvatlantica TaxID=321895 RepID=A0ABR6FZS2_9BURK|nr:hypothetical protein [Paraburkholderia silvatlantica]PVY17880.1 hypothetical protein C7411_14720 [Paraburkholderia silvatlantica]PXW23794.1 hypothetical protein C7413_15122 [Paraburkholderia silvatlantica]TDQ98925.1 hypothetical protein C7412_104142 [Paraburkholderia silvatlantica]